MVEINQQFYRFVFSPIPDEVALAHLYELGFEAFEEKEDSMEGYLPSSIYSEKIGSAIRENYPVKSIELILPQNWNSIWEASFEPIFIDDQVCIRASFHPPSKLPYDIVIDPKMAFGTGHHATTFLVIQEMMKLDLNNKSVLDFGCGSGILAILAEKFGATSIKAIDYDIWSVENSLENVFLNDCRYITIAQSDSLQQESGSYDLILSNITREVLIQNSNEVSRLLKPGGCGIFSGFLVEDAGLMKRMLQDLSFSAIQTYEKEGWCVIRFFKS